MSRPRFLAAAALALLTTTAPAQSTQDLLASFRNPPDAAKPMVRWWWFGPAVEKPEILRELQQMKADGIGGAELAFVYPETLEGNLPFLSPPMLDAVTYAQAEARRLGLRIDLTLCSGWPYGGPATTLAEAATRLRTAEVAVPSGTSTVATPTLAQGETLLAAALVAGTPTPPPVRRGPGPPPASAPRTWDPATAQPFTPSAASTNIPPATEPRVALFFIQSHTKQEVKRAAVGAEGYVLDPFSHDAVATHLKSVGEPLLRAFGSTPPTAIFSDSLEAYGSDWTPTLPTEFQRRRGYDLLPHLPELVAGGSPAAEKVRHDYGQTLTELVDENYLTQINTWAHAHNTKFRSQTYGEPAVSFSSQRLVDLPEGEGPQWRAFSTLRWATSANHVFGNNVTSGETFTWLHSPVFRATPLDMKAEADIDFIMGENQLIFHGWPYSPPASQLAPGDPGWSLYAAAVFNDHNPWHPVMPAVTAYIARISNLLRQGKPANQVAVLLPTHDAWATFTPGTPTQSSLTAAFQKLIPKELLANILSAGYNYDFIDAAAISTVGLAKYQILVIPPTDRIPVATLKKIGDWAKTPGQNKGDNVICVTRCPSIDPQGEPLPGMTGYFMVAQTPADFPKFLHDAAKPDFALTAPNDQVGFIRRKTTDADIYFVANTGNHSVDITADFATALHFGRQVDTDTTVAASTSSHAQAIHMEPYESRIFIFNNESTPPPSGFVGSRLADLSQSWQVTFTGTGKSVTEPTLTDWTASPETLHYSGEAVYTRDFTLPTRPPSPVFLQVDGGTPLPGDPATTAPEHVLMPNGLPDPRITRTGPGMHAYYDPPVREAALVTVNGHPAGALWHPPYRLDVTKLLKPGQNHIEIHVFNTALNAWSAIPPRDYKPLIQKYGDRFQMQDLNQVKPIPSGLLGQIHLVTQGPK